MLALRAGPAQAVAVGEVPPPVPGPAEVLVDVVACGVCATDRKFIARGPAQPRVLGHEVTGRLADGTLVGIHPELACRQCPTCRDGWHNRCPDRLTLGLARDGGLAEQVVVPPAQLVPLNGLDPVRGTLLEPLACAVHAVAVAGITPGEPAVVVGAGTMGILCGWVLRAAGAPVTICQRSAARARLARELGFDVISPEQRLRHPAAAALVTAPGGPALTWALEQVAVGGVVHAFAGSPGGAAVDANLVHYRHLRLVGSTGSRLVDYERARDLVAAGAVPLDRLPHRVVGLAEAAALLAAGGAADNGAGGAVEGGAGSAKFIVRVAGPGGAKEVHR